MKKEIVIKFVNVSKKYVIHHEKPTLMERFVRGKDAEFWAIKKTSISIRKGEKVGIIGPNGSGKTTFLKIITGITQPTLGQVITKGKIVSLIDLGAGFHPDLTGLQNIYLNGMILGMDKEEISGRIKKIISFANLGNFIDSPIYTYSSGMLLRLGFSVAVNADPEILILDENISVGDKRFKEKSIAVLDRLFSEGTTIVIASHDLNFIENNCDRVVLLSKGKIIDDGSAKKVVEKYNKTE